MYKQIQKMATPVLGATQRMSIRTSLQSRDQNAKFIGARGPLTSEFRDISGSGFRTWRSIALNGATVACYVSLLIVSAVFLGQVQNVDTEANRLALGVAKDSDTVRVDGSGLITLRDDTKVQCDPQKVNAQFVRSTRELDLRLRCVPSSFQHEALNRGGLLMAGDNFEDLYRLAYNPASPTAVAKMTAPQWAAYEAAPTTTFGPLTSCSKSLECQPGFQCHLIPKAPIRCNPKLASHTRCRCAVPHINFDLSGITKTSADGRLVDYSEIGTVKKSDLCYSSNPEDVLVESDDATVTTAGGNGDDVGDLCDGTDGGTGGCLLDDGKQFAGIADIGAGLTFTAPTVAAEASSRRLSRHSGARDHNLGAGEAFDCKAREGAGACMTNGERLHELLYGADTESEFGTGQFGPAVMIVVFSAMSTLFGGGTFLVHFVAGRSQDYAGAATWSARLTSKTGLLPVVMSVLANMLDFATDICVLLLLQRAKYNDENDYPYGASGAWMEAGCYGGNLHLGAKKIHDNMAGDFGGDAATVWGMFGIVCARFLFYRVAGSSLYHGDVQV